MKVAKAMGIFLILLCGLFLNTANANAQSCVISFDDSFGLSLLDPSMAYGFMFPGEGIIWYYDQCGGSTSPDWLYLDENPAGGYPAGTAYGHFHIPFADPNINCFTTTSTYPNGVMGIQSSPQSPCLAIDPYNKPRTLLPHHPDGILRIIYLGSVDLPKRYILPNAIRVIGPTPVSVLFQAADGSWWIWSDLPAGNWSLTGALPAKQVFILSSAVNAGTPWQIADLGITLGDYIPPTSTSNVCLLCSQGQHRTVRDFLSTISSRRSANRQMTSAEVPGSEASLLGATQNQKSARSISEQEALRVFARPPDSPEFHGGNLDIHDGNLEEILYRIPGAYGTERQVLIGNYLLAASKLPQSEQAAAQRRLVALFESKR
jgi:hypothetical protein